MNRITVAAAALAALGPAVALTSPTATAAPAPTTDARAAAPYEVTAKINTDEAIAGEDVVRISGSVSPKAAGQTVVLQQRKDGRNRWVKSGTAKIRPTGRFVLKDDPSTMGVRYYRVLKPASDGLAAGRSEELRLAVWGWELLTYRPVGATLGIRQDQSPQFGTESYYHSLTTAVGGSGYAEYTLGRKCRVLRATYALTDDSATGATGNVSVAVDGLQRINQPLTTGTIVEQLETDVTNAFRIRFDASASATPAGTAAIGTPEVLCLD